MDFCKFVVPASTCHMWLNLQLSKKASSRPSQIMKCKIFSLNHYLWRLYLPAWLYTEQQMLEYFFHVLVLTHLVFSEDISHSYV